MFWMWVAHDAALVVGDALVGGDGGVAGGGHPSRAASEGVSVPLYIKLLPPRCREMRYVLAAPSAKGEMAAELSE